MRTINLGILAHVDAGKTSLTERLLYAAGVVKEIGSVDRGSTQTDTLALERQRGITIKSAVVSFVLGGAAVNLIDTPGHPDFIAEVERVLSVLDGAVLVISAVEGVQPQTRVLMRTLQRLRIPTLLFVNKTDRGGARYEELLRSVASRLTLAAIPMGLATGLGTRGCGFTAFGPADPQFLARLTEVLADQDEELLAAYVTGTGELPYPRLRRELAVQVWRAAVHPVYFGSAVTGTGVEELITGITELLPPAGGDPAGPVTGTVFKMERGPAGEKIAYVRMFSGTLRTRDRVRFTGPDGRRAGDGKITSVRVFAGGEAVPSPAVQAGQIGQLRGLREIRIGDRLGDPAREAGAGARHFFAPPTLETAVVPARPEDKAALKLALEQLAEQDPLINVRQDDRRQELSVSLYGEVQKEVVQATLAADYGVDATFADSTVICVERPAGTGEAVEFLNTEQNPYQATIGIRIEPGAPESECEIRLGVGARQIPLYIYKSVEGFLDAMGRYVRDTLREGLYGWQVTDCVVTLVDCNYSVADGPPSQRGPTSTPGDFKKLTPLVVMGALSRAGTVVCEPIHRFSVELPTDRVGSVLSALTQLRATPEKTVQRGDSSFLTGTMPASLVHRLQQQLPGLTHGEGVLESAYDSYQPVLGPAPERPRTDLNPLRRKEYLWHVQRRI